jgi:hypothetical protein
VILSKNIRRATIGILILCYILIVSLSVSLLLFRGGYWACLPAIAGWPAVLIMGERMFDHKADAMCLSLIFVLAASAVISSIKSWIWMNAFAILWVILGVVFTIFVLSGILRT